MNKNPKNIVRSIISKSGKILRSRMRKKASLAGKEKMEEKKKFSRIRKIKDKIKSVRMRRKKREMKIAKAWNRDFQGSFDHTVRKTAEFIRKRKSQKTM